ncbi:MAG: hypothetical protein DRJ63_10130 [Thermoprotei archaeon]|nr:MAG: hypothetical protein DRJ63_10130 [Thermoprotei archaeon]
MKAYQLRVVAEKKILDENAHELSDFIGLSAAFLELSTTEQKLLKEQGDIMWQLSEVLGKRISAFN